MIDASLGTMQPRRCSASGADDDGRLQLTVHGPCTTRRLIPLGLLTLARYYLFLVIGFRRAQDDAERSLADFLRRFRETWAASGLGIYRIFIYDTSRQRSRFSITTIMIFVMLHTIHEISLAALPHI